MLKFSKCERWDGSRFIIFFNPQEVEHANPDGSTIKVEQYAKSIIVPEVSKGEIVDALIREKYSVSAEIALLRQKASKKAEFAAYDAFAEECKVLAGSILEALKS